MLNYFKFRPFTQMDTSFKYCVFNFSSCCQLDLDELMPFVMDKSECQKGGYKTSMVIFQVIQIVR